jgi:hypothetical protein
MRSIHSNNSACGGTRAIPNLIIVPSSPLTKLDKAGPKNKVSTLGVRRFCDCANLARFMLRVNYGCDLKLHDLAAGFPCPVLEIHSVAVQLPFQLPRAHVTSSRVSELISLQSALRRLVSLQCQRVSFTVSDEGRRQIYCVAVSWSSTLFI